MSQRVAKIESQIQRVVALALVDLLGPESARVTVTRVDAAPDLRNAVVWVGILGQTKEQEAIFATIERGRAEAQAEVARQSTAKFAPRLHFRRDSGGAHAADIERLLRGL